VSVTIHPTALVDGRSQLGTNVNIGPFAIVEGDTVIGDGTQIGPHATIQDGSRIGARCRIFQGASVGGLPQDLKFAGEKTTLVVGDNTTIREFVTLNRGTSSRGETRIGSNCLIMAYCHVAHDCIVGNDVIISNNLAMAGHVEVEDFVTIGGVVAIHQFVRIGRYSMVGAKTYLTQDVVPFALCAGEKIEGINSIGLERRGFDAQRRQDLKRAFKTLFRDNLLLSEALARLAQDFPENGDVQEMISFIQKNRRGLLRM